MSDFMIKFKRVTKKEIIENEDYYNSKLFVPIEDYLDLLILYEELREKNGRQ